MKKVMIAAAVAAMIAGAYAGNCKEDPETPEVDCVDVFTVKFCGKTANEDTKTVEYKTVKKVSAKGYLTLNDYVTETLAVKVGKDSYNVVLEDGEVTKFTVFGKKLANVTDEDLMKPGKTTKLEADLGVKFEGATDYEINLNQVAFGSVKAYITKEVTKKSSCGEDETTEGCELVMTPASFSGWFTGDFQNACLDEEGFDNGCIEFDADGTTALVGGTWTAKYSTKLSVKASN